MNTYELERPELGAREQALLGLFDALAPEDQQLLEPRVIDGFTTLDIAARLGISRSDAVQRIHILEWRLRRIAKDKGLVQQTITRGHKNCRPVANRTTTRACAGAAQHPGVRSADDMGFDSGDTFLAWACRPARTRRRRCPARHGSPRKGQGDVPGQSASLG